jgi:hypothetical protein
MAYDPVFDRQMFQPKSSKGKGIVALVDDNADTSDLEARRQRAMEMLAQAKQEQDPANYQTLSDRERPMVFRPTAVNLPQQPQQPPVAQQMAQMQAAGLRPVGMAEGGIAHFVEGGLNTISPTIAPTDEDPSIFKRFSDYFYPNGPKTMAVGSDAKYTLPDVGLRVGGAGEAGIISLKEPVDSVSPPTESKDNPALWTDQDIADIADKIVSTAKTSSTPAGRILQGTDPFDKQSVIKRLEDQREQEIKLIKNPISPTLPPGRDEELRRAQEDFAKRQEVVGEIKKASPVKSIFEAQTPEDRNAAIAAQETAVSEVLKPTGMAQTEGGSGDYMSRISTTPPAIPPTTPSGFDAQTAGGSGNYMSRIPTAPSEGIKTVKPVVPAPDKDAPDKDHPTDLKDIKAGKDNDFWMAVTRAGLGMAAGKSSNPLTNIAEGGIQGLEQYATKAARDRAANLEERKLGITEQHYKMLREAADERQKGITQSRSIAQQNALVRAETAVNKEYASWENKEGMKIVTDAQNPNSPTRNTSQMQIEAKKKELADKYLKFFAGEAVLATQSNGLGLNSSIFDGE